MNYKRVFVWENKMSWFEKIIKIIFNNFSINILNDLIFSKMLNPNNIFENIMNELNYSEFESQFNEILLNTWSFYRTYHATRVNNISTYLLHGIRPKTINELNNIFYSKLESHVKRDVIKKTIHKLSAMYDEQDEKVFLSIDKQHLINHCNHYLNYGSEYILTGISLLNDSRDILKKVIVQENSQPVIFECEIPVEIIDRNNLKNIFKILLYESVIMYLLNDYYPLSRRTSLKINTKINPQWIVKYYEINAIQKRSNILPPLWY